MFAFLDIAVFELVNLAVSVRHHMVFVDMVKITRLYVDIRLYSGYLLDMVTENILDCKSAALRLDQRFFFCTIYVCSTFTGTKQSIGNYEDTNDKVIHKF